VNPNDTRFSHLVGKKVRVPFINREIPVIADEYVDMEFGTGCLKVTPAHDRNDYELGQKYNLPVIDILTEDGVLNENAEDSRYIGKDRFEVRKLIAADLEAAGHLLKTEDYKNQVGTSERTGAVIEPRLSMQWFVDMKAFIARNPQVLDAVMSDEIKFHPAKMKNTYRHWIDNIKDWCISRQLWWGQRIPAWYDEAGNYVVAKTTDEAAAAYEKTFGKKAALKQDEDVVDTWFSSWLWPITVFDGLPVGDLSKQEVMAKRNADIKYFYPTNDLVTAPEIMFFWVARMIMAGYEWMGEKPFSNVYYTGIVRDKQRRKMSKSLGNSPDPLDLIAQHGADAVRMGMLLCSPAGNDILYDEALVEQGRNFSNKLWNAFRLVKGWEVKPDSEFDSEVLNSNQRSVQWFEGRLNDTLKDIEEKFSDYRLSEALMTTYKLIWDDFCSWYLEMVKPAYQQPIDERTYTATVNHFETLLRLLHPFMPFVTEELWQHLAVRKEGESICVAAYPKTTDGKAVDLSRVFECITQIRNLRNAKGLSPKAAFDISIRTTTPELYEGYTFLITKLANVNAIHHVSEAPEQTQLVQVHTDEVYVHLLLEVDADAERARIEKEIEYLNGFLKSVDAKLSNEKFVANAKAELVEKERQKKADAESKLSTLQKSLASLR
jgi:valyl-tRNA synthetase